jgi:hypothetical protein
MVFSCKRLGMRATAGLAQKRSIGKYDESRLRTFTISLMLDQFEI